MDAERQRGAEAKGAPMTTCRGTGAVGGASWAAGLGLTCRRTLGSGVDQVTVGIAAEAWWRTRSFAAWPHEALFVHCAVRQSPDSSLVLSLSLQPPSQHQYGSGNGAPYGQQGGGYPPQPPYGGGGGQYGGPPQHAYGGGGLPGPPPGQYPGPPGRYGAGGGGGSGGGYGGQQGYGRDPHGGGYGSW